MISVQGKNRFFLRAAYCISFLFVCAVLFSESLITGVKPFFWGNYPQFGMVGIILLLFYFPMFVKIISTLWSGYNKASTDRTRRRLKGLIYGLCVGYSGAVDFIACFGVSFYPFGYLFEIVFVAITTYLIMRYQLEDITPQTAVKQIIKTMQGALMVTDREGRIRVVNDAACALFGYKEPEMIDMQLASLFNVPDEMRNLLLLAAHPVNDHHLSFFDKQGKTIDLSVSASVLTSGNEPQGIVYVALDISGRIELENEIARARDAAEAANRAKSFFLANMSHEIRSPLNGIIGMTELIRETELDEKQCGLFDTMMNEANALNELINGILDFSKIEAGKMELEDIPFDLRYLLKTLAGTFACQAARKGITFRQALPAHVPIQLIGDPGRLKQVLRNLTTNAIKFTPEEGEIRINVEVVKEDEEGATLHFEVLDTGIGIPEDKQKRIFESFTQADGSTTRKYGGTGLGTTIAKQLVELMGGTIGVRSREGKGSVFWFTITCRKNNNKAVGMVLREGLLHGKRILIVDRNAQSRAVLMQQVQAWGCLSIGATGEEEALTEIMQRHTDGVPVDLMVVDMHFADLGNSKLLQQYRMMQNLERVPLVVLTSAGARGDGQKCRALGIRAYFTKPMTWQYLYQTMVTVFGQSDPALQPAALPLITKHFFNEKRKDECRILLVEDYPTNQQVAMSHLEKSGFVVDLAENGRQAIAAYKRHRYDLILMDMQMPVMDGYEATQEIRTLETEMPAETAGLRLLPDKRIPIIALTAHATKEDRERCFAAGMDDYLIKPFKKDVLLATVTRWVGSSTFVAHDCMGQFVESDVSREADTTLDFGGAVEEFGGNKGLVLKILGDFIAKGREQIEVIRQALLQADSETVRKECHAIKGGAGNLTARDLSMAARCLEELARSGELETGGVAVDVLEQQFLRLKERYAILMKGEPQESGQT
jgi:two-component system, sensor histidine kinase and response regulator